MAADPFVGVMYHWLGGLAAASFYIPFKAVKNWSWETYWLVGGFFSWIIAPILLASALVPNLMGVFHESPGSSLFWAYAFGVVWGIGGLSFGLAMRYLGIALGYAIALGMCAAFGTIVPPIFHGTLIGMFREHPGQLTLVGILICMGGIVLSGMAGISKERELTSEQKRGSVREFDFVKGLGVTLLAGVLSAAMAFALDAAGPINEAALRHLEKAGAAALWQGLPALVIVLLGGFTTNFLWCVFLNIRNRSVLQYAGFRARDTAEIAAAEGVGNFDVDAIGASGDVNRALRAAHMGPGSLMVNYLFSALAGVTWYFQFFFYTMGTTKMGRFGFSSWTLHMASIIIFSTLWGIGLKEWVGTSARTKFLVGMGMVILILSTVVVGWGNYLSAKV